MDGPNQEKFQPGPHVNPAISNCCLSLSSTSLLSSPQSPSLSSKIQKPRKTPLSLSYTLTSKPPSPTGRMREEEIEKLRGVVRDCVSKHLYSSAIFFADKVAAFTSDPADIYMQAQALFLGRHYRRAFHLLNASQIVLRDLRFRYLAAKCLVRPQFRLSCFLVLVCRGNKRANQAEQLIVQAPFENLYVFE